MTDQPKLGELGVHDKYHLSPAEKRLLAREVQEYVASRFAGPPCASCLFDTLAYATAEHTEKTLVEGLNSGTAADFDERLSSVPDHFYRLASRARKLLRAAIDREQRQRDERLLAELSTGPVDGFEQ